MPIYWSNPRTFYKPHQEVSRPSSSPASQDAVYRTLTENVLIWRVTEGKMLLAVIGLVLLSSSTYAADHSCALTQHVPAFHAPQQSRLKTLLRFGRQNRISFGIETSSVLAEQTEVNTPPGTVASVVKAISGMKSPTKLECFEGVVLLRDQATLPPAWLNVIVPEFRIPRTMLGLANAALWMRVETALDPQKQGFAGDIPGDDLTEQVGPYNVKQASARALLCRLAASSRGTIWIVGEVNEGSGTSWRNRLWTLIPYGKDHF